MGGTDVQYYLNRGGLALDGIISRIVSATGAGTVVDILIGIVGAVAGGLRLSLLCGNGVTGFNMDVL